MQKGWLAQFLLRSPITWFAKSHLFLDTGWSLKKLREDYWHGDPPFHLKEKAQLSYKLHFQISQHLSIFLLSITISKKDYSGIRISYGKVGKMAKDSILLIGLKLFILLIKEALGFTRGNTIISPKVVDWLSWTPLYPIYLSTFYHYTMCLLKLQRILKKDSEISYGLDTGPVSCPTLRNGINSRVHWLMEGWGSPILNWK